MAEFHSVIMTQDGLRLISLSQGMSKPLSFTKIMLGDGVPVVSEDISQYSELLSPKLQASITRIAPINASGATEARWAVYGAYSNNTLPEGFYIKEVGLYAKVEASDYADNGWDGYKGEELLIGYVYAEEGKADWFPSAIVAQETQEIVFYYSVGNASSVMAYVPEESFVRHEDLTAHIEDTNPHAEVFAKYATQTALELVKSQAGIVEGNVSNANSWWVKLGGAIPLLIQGGRVAFATIDDNKTQTVTFPKEFAGTPTVLCSINFAGRVTGAVNVYVGTPSKTKVTFYGDASDNAMSNAGVNWIAIGI